MEFRVLRYFLAVAREQSILRASQVLHISQPTLSRQIRELEEELGAVLFHRGSRKITLTDEGVLLRKRAEEIADLVNKAEGEISAAGETISGTVYVGAGETHAFRPVVRAMRNLQARHSEIRFNLFSGHFDDVAEKLDKGLLDFGLIIEPANLTKYASIRLPVMETLGVLMLKDSPLAKLESISPEDLWDKPLIFPRQTMEGNQLSGWLKKDLDKLNVAATYNLLFNASLMVKEGMGYAVCLDDIIDTSGETNLCFRPLQPAIESYVDVIWKKHQVFGKASELFLEELRRVVG